MRTIPRILLLLFSLSAMTMLFIGKCGLYIDQQLNPETFPHTRSSKTRELFSAALEETEKRYQTRVEELEEKVRSLKSALTDQNWVIQNNSRKSEDSEEENITVRNVSFVALSNSSLVEYIKQTLINAEILHGVEMKTEYDVIAFNRFTANRVFLVDPGLGKRVVEKPIGFKRKDLSEVISYSIAVLNQNRSSSVKKYTLNEFTEGIYRIEPNTGTHYELYFHNIDQVADWKYSKVTIMRPFGPLMMVKSDSIYTGGDWINIILPLQGRLDSFRSFIARFINTCILMNQKVFLTVVYFGKQGLDDVRNIIDSTSREHHFNHMKVVTINEKFSRGRGFQYGSLNWQGGDVVMFMCDVDIVFTVDFLERCRLNTVKRKRVYYPVVFSLYNPHVVYKLHDLQIPPEKEQLVIAKENGFWRDFGYGMTCQYLSDFQKVKGFDSQIKGWGGEDVALYKKYVKSEYMVVRATDPGIFHLWHEKVCDPNLGSEQYQGCIRSKALNEASHSQLGLLAFKDEVNIHKGYKRRIGERASSYLSRHKK